MKEEEKIKMAIWMYNELIDKYRLVYEILKKRYFDEQSEYKEELEEDSHKEQNKEVMANKEEIEEDEHEKEEVKPCSSCEKNGLPNCGNEWCFTNKEKK